MALKKYTFVKDYKSDAGIWHKGESVDLSEDVAAWFNRDVDGCLEEAKQEKKTEARAETKPPADRQVKAAEQTRGEGAMTKADFKATKERP